MAFLEARLIPTGERDFAMEVKWVHNPTTKLPIASLSKSLTAYLVFEAVQNQKMSYDDYVDINPTHYCLPDNNFATKQLPEGLRRIKVGEALTLLLRQSNNTAALILADAVAGDVHRFVTMMNAKAKDWDMNSTHFTSPHGLPPKDRSSEYTTVSDMAIMGKNMLVHEVAFRHFASVPLVVEGKIIAQSESPAKAALRKLTSFFKTATSAGCPSLLAIFDVGHEKFLSVQLCADTKKNRFDMAVEHYQDYVRKARDWIGVSPTSPEIR